jgi:hypothetical protein
MSGRAPKDDAPEGDSEGDRPPRRRWVLTGKGYRITDPEPPAEDEDETAGNP